MNLPRRFTAALLLLAPCLALAQTSAQGRAPDVLDEAAFSTLKRDNANLVCLGKQASVQDMRDTLLPYVKGVDTTDRANYRTLVLAVYQALPCPFSPARPELKPAGKGDLLGSWVFPDASLKLRHGPQSPAWRDLPPGVPQIKCEGVSFHESGEYRVAQLRGTAATCPTLASMEAMRAYPRVQSWQLLQDGRVRIDRTDVPEAFEEWDVFVVQSPFEFFGVKFAVGDLAAYQRKGRGNDIGAVTVFRHLQRLN